MSRKSMHLGKTHLFGAAWMIAIAAAASQSPPNGAFAQETIVEKQSTAADPADGMFITRQREDEYSVRILIGKSVYDASMQPVGDVNDLILGPEGNVVAIVIGLGGFLGIGEKEVAVPFEAISVRELPDAKIVELHLNVTGEEFNAAADYRTKAEIEAERQAREAAARAAREQATDGTQPTDR